MATPESDELVAVLRCGRSAERRFASAIDALDSEHLVRLFTTYARAQRLRCRVVADMLGRLGASPQACAERRDALIALPGPTDRDIIAGCRSEQARLLTAYDRLLADAPPECFELALRAQRRDVRRVGAYLTALELHATP